MVYIPHTLQKGVWGIFYLRGRGKEMGILDALLWLTLNIYHEGRSEPDIAQQAIAHVTLNRAKNKNKPVKEIVLEPYQFSWTFQKETYTPDDLTAFRKCLKNAIEAVGSSDFTGGSDHYHLETIRPPWSTNMLQTGKWGKHLFYKDIIILKGTKKKVKS